jgi:hypothetical protein
LTFGPSSQCRSLASLHIHVKRLQWWQQHCQKLHKERLAAVSKMVDTDAPLATQVTLSAAKKEQIKAARQQEIDHVRAAVRFMNRGWGRASADVHNRIMMYMLWYQVPQPYLHEANGDACASDEPAHGS